MKIKTIIFFYFLLIISNSFSQNRNDTFKIIHEKNTSEKLVIQFNQTDYSIDYVKTIKGKAAIITSKKSSSIQQKEAPELPKYTRSIIVPENAEIKISVIESKFTEINDILIAPSKGILSRQNNPADIPFEFGEQYSKDELFPGKIAETGENYILRDFHGQSITVYPFQYNPVKKVLRIYQELVLEINESKGKVLGIEQNLHKIDREFSRIYEQQFLNYGIDFKYSPLEEEGKMLVVCHSDYMAAMQDFVNWKNQRGLKTEIVEFSTIGTSANQLKDYVTNYYNTNGLTYLLLVGDSEHIPSIQKSGDSDAAYGHILGNDSYAEVFVGRFSAQSVANVETQVQRTIYYEKEIGTDATWLSKAIGIASDEGTAGEGDDGESDRQHMDNIRTDLLNYGYTPVEQIYDPGASATTLATKINEGVGIIDYIGHGSDYSWVTTGFSTTGVNNLTNENMLPFIFDVACVNGNFHNQTCFAESWMRASKNSNPTGAVAIIASTINQSWSSPMDAQDEMIDILTQRYTQNIKRTFGGITVNGIMHMIDEYGSDGSDMANTWTIFGDPSLLVRTKTPTSITISHPSSIVMGNAQLVVSGVDGAFISLTKENEIIASGEKIENDVLILEFESLTELTTLVITATGYNKATYVSEINVLNPTTPYVIKDLVEINDSDGNNNNLLEFGEISKLNVQLKNITDSFDAFEVTARIIATHSNIVLLDSLETFGTILKDTISLINDAFKISVSNTIVDQKETNISLEINGKDSEDSTYTWISNLRFTLNAPKIDIGELLIDDSSGDNNGILDPGETAILKLIVKNIGHSSIDGLNGLIEQIGEDDYLAITDSTSEFFSLSSGFSDTIEFMVSASTEATIGTPVELKLSIIDNNHNFYSASSNKTITIGKIPEYLISEGGTHTISINSLFYDSGGPDSSYVPDENNSITFIPADNTKVVKVNFTSFNVEPDGVGCYDYLSIYNGETTEAEKIGDFCSANPPTEIIAENEAGALTFVFSSDGYVEESGWEAEISLVSLYSVTFVVASSGNAVENAMVSFNSIDKFTNSSGEVVFNNITSSSSLSYVIRKPGFENETGTIDVSSDITKDIQLTEGIAKYTAQFTLTDGTNAIDGATINFDDQQGTTDAEGKYTFTETSYGLNKKFIISKEKYFQYIDSVDVDTNLTIPVTMSLEKYSIAFQVTNNANSGPLQGVQVNFNSSIKVTDSNGMTTFNNIEPKTGISYTLSKTGFVTFSGNLDVVNENKTIDVIMYVISSVNDFNSESFSIFPNPSQGILNIDFGSLYKGNAQIDVFDILGKSVFNKEVIINENTNEIIDLTNQVKGIYFVSIKFSTGEHFSRKIIIE